MYMPSACLRCQAAMISGISCPACGLVRTRDGRSLTLASPGRRLCGYLITCFFVWLPVFFLFIWLILTIIAASSSSAAGADSGVAGIGAATFLILGLILSAVLSLGYVIWWIMLASNGQTPSKKLLGMQVVKLDGSPADFGTMLLRSFVGKYLLGIVTFYFYGTVDALWLLWDKEKQCLHDKLAKTLVVMYEEQAQPYAARQPIAGTVPYQPAPAAPAGFDPFGFQQQPAPVRQRQSEPADLRTEVAPPRQPPPAPAGPVWPAPSVPAAAPPRAAKPPSGTPAERLKLLQRDYVAGKVTEEQYRYWKTRLRRETAEQEGGNVSSW